MNRLMQRLGAGRVSVVLGALTVLGLSGTSHGADEDRVLPMFSPATSLMPAPASDDSTDSAVYLQPALNPAEKAAERSRAATGPVDLRRPTNPFADRMPSYEMPAVNVVGDALPEFREEDKVGPYAQPRWTARRFTPGTRVYVRPPGTVEFEYWLRPTIGKDGNTELRTLYEIGVGLPYRLQLDMYLRTDSGGDGAPTEVGQQLEIRWALADWNKIWGNPTVYAEYVQHDESPDQIEFKLLLGGEVSPRWHWGVNLVAELTLGGDREYEYQVTGGVTYAVVDSVFSLGGEFRYLFADTQGNRGDFSHALLIGPTLTWRPIEQLRISFAPLVGVTDDSPTLQAFLNVGWEF